MIRPTASSAGVLSRCGHWTTLDPPAREPNAAMALGTEVHALIESHIAGRKVDTRTVSDDAKRLMASWFRDVEPLIPKLAAAELALSWDHEADHAVELGRNLNRDYSAAKPGAFCGSVDAAWVGGPGAIVVDWKCSNAYDTDAERYTPQLRALALMVARAWRVESVETWVVHIREDGCEIAKATLDALELDTIAAELGAAMRQTLEPRPGNHCSRCQAVSVCSATARAIVEVPAMSLAVDTPADVARIWGPLRAAKAAIEQIEKRAKEIVRANGEVPLLDGKRLRMVQVSGRESVSLKDLENAVGSARMADLREAGVVKRGAPYEMMKEST